MKKNLYTLTPYIYSDYEVTEEIKDILSHPWKTFVVILEWLFQNMKRKD